MTCYKFISVRMGGTVIAISLKLFAKIVSLLLYEKIIRRVCTLNCHEKVMEYISMEKKLESGIVRY